VSEGATIADAARESESVRPATEADRPEIIGVLARAFYDDPIMSWLCPDDSRRLRQLERLFGFFDDKVWRGHDLAFTTGRLAGAAIWLPPDAWHLGPLQQIRMLPGMVRRAGLSTFGRLFRTLNLMESEHPREHHYYLPIIGVDPAWQGRGLGTALLRAMTERCDREGMPAYLEASSPRSRVCYERSGFEATGELTPPPDGPPLWPMWRKPVGAAA
jgi:GNAT superfamily N-acetyltransferase